MVAQLRARKVREHIPAGRPDGRARWLLANRTNVWPSRAGRRGRADAVDAIYQLSVKAGETLAKYLYPLSIRFRVLRAESRAFYHANTDRRPLRCHCMFRAHYALLIMH